MPQGQRETRGEGAVDMQSLRRRRVCVWRTVVFVSLTSVWRSISRNLEPRTDHVAIEGGRRWRGAIIWKHWHWIKHAVAIYTCSMHKKPNMAHA